MDDRVIRTRTLVFDCAQGRLVAILLLDNATILLADRGATLRRVPGATPETFTDGISRFATDGHSASLTMPGAQLTSCRHNQPGSIVTAADLRGANLAIWDTAWRWSLIVSTDHRGRLVAELTEGAQRRTYGPLRTCSARNSEPCWLAGDPWELRLVAVGGGAQRFELQLRGASGIESRTTTQSWRPAAP